ncbi:hypothetical protein Pmani_003967 [Petrolisthes manimaculis]|uniref:CD80-like immunoglobulin C2-set domain-containing protein n=1 Tax=Petrolisthes manimaculis TaxID=1843537 RepID=A0AAE1QEK5_9EUCA|nr:hypothetical protein Pmani_003967 [Petrolisthes manimaculis]
MTGVTRATSGTFRCEVMSDKPYFETDDLGGNMTVVDVPKWGPRVTAILKKPQEGVKKKEGGGDGDGGNLHERVVKGGEGGDDEEDDGGERRRSRVGPGDILSAQCLLSPSDPPAQFTWSLNSGPLPHNTFPRTSTQRDQHGTNLQISEINSVVVSEEWFTGGALTLTCQATVSTVYEASVNLTLLHQHHPTPSGFGWFSVAASPTTEPLLLYLLLLLQLLLL